MTCKANTDYKNYKSLFLPLILYTWLFMDDYESIPVTTMPFTLNLAPLHCSLFLFSTPQ